MLRTQALGERRKLTGFPGTSGRLDFGIEAGETVGSELCRGRF